MKCFSINSLVLPLENLVSKCVCESESMCVYVCVCVCACVREFNTPDTLKPERKITLNIMTTEPMKITKVTSVLEQNGLGCVLLNRILFDTIQVMQSECK